MKGKGGLSRAPGKKKDKGRRRRAAVALLFILLVAGSGWLAYRLRPCHKVPPAPASHHASVAPFRKCIFTIKNSPSSGTPVLSKVDRRPSPETPGIQDSRNANPCVYATDLDTAISLQRSRLAVFIDTRPTGDYAEGHIPGAVNIPATDFTNALARNRENIPADAQLVIYGETTGSGETGTGCERLHAAGYQRLLYFADGWRKWYVSNMPIEK